MPTVTVTPASAPIKKRATFLDKLRRLINDAEAEFGGMNPSAPGAISNMQATADEADCPEATDALDGADKSATHVHIHMHGAEDNDDHSLMSQTTDADPTGEANPTAASAGIGGDGGENQVTLESLAEELAMQRQLIMKLMQLQEKDLDADELARQSATSEGAEDGEEGAPEDEAAEGTETMDGVGTDDPVGASEADGPRDSDALGGADDSKRGKAVTGDSSALANDWRRLLSDANILVPGFRLPTFDAKAKRAATIDAMCSARRSALRTAYATADGATMLHTLSGMNDLNLEKLPCGEVKGLFTAAVGAKKLANNRSATADANRLPAGFQNEREATVVVGAMQTPAQLNDFYAKHYGPKAQ